MDTPITPRSIEWEASEPTSAEAYPTIGGEDFEIEISGREREHTAYYSVSMPNRRSWTVSVMGGEEIATGMADGLGKSKLAAVAALNDYLGRS